MSQPGNVTSRPLDPAEIAEALALLRAGSRSTIYSGRAGTSYYFKDDHFIEDHYEEDDSSPFRISEEQLLQAIARKPQPFRRVLLQKPWAAFSDAFRADDRIKARQLLRATLEHSDYYFLVLDVFLAWPGEKPAKEKVAQLIEQLGRAPDAFGLAVQSSTFDKDRTTYLRAAAFLDTLDDIAGNPGGHHHHRATFHERGRYYAHAADDYRRALSDPICMKSHDARRFSFLMQDMLDKAAAERGKK